MPFVSKNRWRILSTIDESEEEPKEIVEKCNCISYMSNPSGVHNCIGRSATWTGQPASGFKSLGGASKDKTKTITRKTRKKAAQMSDLVDSSDSESESETLAKVASMRSQDQRQENQAARTFGSSQFGSSLKNKNAIQETRTVGTRHFGSIVKGEEESKKKDKGAGSNCGSHFGSGSSPTGRHLDEEKNTDELRIIQTIMPEGVNAVSTRGEWEYIELAVDSGATETVVGEDMLTDVETKESWASKNGVQYEVANGERIPNVGEKKFHGITENGMTRNITAQVCDVNKALLSVKKIIAAGNRVTFDEEGSFIEDKSSGEKMWLREDKGMFMLKMWVKGSLF